MSEPEEKENIMIGEETAEEISKKSKGSMRKIAVWSTLFIILFAAVAFDVSCVQQRHRKFEPTKEVYLSKENRELLNGRVFHTPTPTPRPTPVPTSKPQQNTTYSYSKPKTSKKNKQTYFSFPDDDEYYMDEDEWMAWHGDEYKSEEDALDMYYWLYG